MHDQIKRIIEKALCLPISAIPYHVSQQLSTIYPQRGILEGSDPAFNVEAFARADLCTMHPKRVQIYNQSDTSWNPMSKKLYQTLKNGSVKVTWQGNQLDLLLMSWEGNLCAVKYYWILADTKEVAENFFSAVCEWNLQIRREVEILEFQSGYWSKNPELFKSIKTAIFDNLILEGTLKQDIQNDLTNFFASRETYEAYGVPWKRGILFIGSPGNGKTHTVKAVLNQMQQPCLYVKNFDSDYGIPDDNIYRVFQRGRASAPCILVLEDLDSLINEENRSFFLNELDGFISNEGIVILATTNHPERIDPAIINRPSRFDRKYYFELPAETERIAYIQLWNEQSKQPMRLSDTEISQIAELTDGFSFAYLKELCLSSMMQWMKTRTLGTMGQIMMSQVTVLKQQISS